MWLETVFSRCVSVCHRGALFKTAIVELIQHIVVYTLNTPTSSVIAAVSVG